MRKELKLPESAYPKKLPGQPECACMKKELRFAGKEGLIFWNALMGEIIEPNRAYANIEVAKKTYELFPEQRGRLIYRSVQDGDTVTSTTVLGYYDTMEEA